MTIKDVAATRPMVWSLEKKEYIPLVGLGSLPLEVDRIHPRLFEDGTLVLVEDEPVQKAAPKKKAAVKDKEVTNGSND